MAKTIDGLFEYAVKHKASDLHLLEGQPPIVRIDGVLNPIAGQKPLTREQVAELSFSILSPRQRQVFEQEREFDLSYEIARLSRFRVNLHYEREAVGLVARVIATQIPTMQELDLPKTAYDLLQLEQGLVLVTGPTGMGKSTTLAAMIEVINQERNEHIVTLEDPIEFLYTPKKSLIRQRQLGSDMLTFAAALKHVLRQDPNVILVGEMRDLETISSTITLAETGHLVLATLHTLNAAQTIDRIIDVFPPYQQPQVRLQVSLFLKAIISQQLLPKVGGGRLAAREILINTPAIGNLIRENKIPQIKTAMQTSADVGMVTMDQDIKRLYQDGKITKEVALAHMPNPQLLR
ncbi:MAG: type IV pilus twitching motility protein PilT [Candidatus Kerfeldbacteria bacterium]|nr:type IV pilus twitching motility protein PilT [Candidatus Kerfeldbacteria bacterium]